MIKNQKLGYIVNLIVTIVCIALGEFLLKDHAFYEFVIGFVVAGIVNGLLGAKWKPWKSIK